MTFDHLLQLQLYTLFSTSLCLGCHLVNGSFLPENVYDATKHNSLDLRAVHVPDFDQNLQYHLLEVVNTAVSVVTARFSHPLLQTVWRQVAMIQRE